MKNVVSYSLFGKNCGGQKYQKFLPAIIAANVVGYHDFIHKFYVADDAVSSPAAQLLLEVSSRHDSVRVKIMPSKYNGIKPMLWRILPWWDKDVKYLLCRDVDSLLTDIELKSVRYFLSTKYKLHSIRSHPYHTTPLMGGLSSFDCEWMRSQRWFLKNFRVFIKRAIEIMRDYKPWVRGSDQEVLKRFIYYNCVDCSHNMSQTLDCPVQKAPITFGDYRPKVRRYKAYRDIDIKYMDKHKELFNISKRFHPFVASPFKTLSFKKVKLVLNAIDDKISQDITQSIKENNNIYEFYKGCI